MFNHARTLLLNRSADGTPGFTWPGEQAVPAGFRKLELPSALDTVRARLFGADPDRAMLNYRLWQFMRLLHATPELEEFVLDLDSRVTYVTSTRTDLFDPATFNPVITQVAGVTSPIFIQGSPSSPDVQGRMYHQYRVDIVSPTTIGVEQQTKPRDFTIYDATYTEGLSNRIPLGNSGYGVLVGSDTPSVEWRVSVFNRPTWELGDIAVSLQSIGEPVLLQLFGASLVEPYKTFFNLWTDNAELPSRLGGLLLALIYRTDQIRGAIG